MSDQQTTRWRDHPLTYGDALICSLCWIGLNLVKAAAGSGAAMTVAGVGAAAALVLLYLAGRRGARHAE